MDNTISVIYKFNITSSNCLNEGWPDCLINRPIVGDWVLATSGVKLRIEKICHVLLKGTCEDHLGDRGVPGLEITLRA